MELAKGVAYIDGKGKITADNYFNILEKEGIIRDKEKDVVDKGNGKYEVTTEPGYIFEVTITEKGDIEIDYIGKGENIGPRIREIRITNKTTNSVTVEVDVKNAEDADYTYSYQKVGETEWKDAGTSKNNTCTIDNLEINASYTIKVKVETKDGADEDEISTTIGELPKGTITFGEVEWVGDGTASVVINTSEKGYQLQYQKNSIDGQWTTIGSGEKITGLKHNDTVYGRLYDGVNGTKDEVSISIQDLIDPVVTVTKGTITTNSIQVSVSAKDNESGMKETPTYNYYIKKTNEDDSSYVLKGNTLTQTSYTFSGLQQETSYDIKVEVTGDKAGRKGTGILANQTTTKVGGAEGGLTTGSIVASTPTWSGGTASIQLTTSTGMQIQYQVGGITEGSWTTVSTGAKVSGLHHNDTVYARLYDGTNAGDYGSISIIDNTPPTVSISTSNLTHNSVTLKVTASDNESGLATSGTYKYYLDSESSPRETSTTNSYNYTGLTASTKYILKVIVTDKAGKTAEKSTTITTGVDLRSEVQKAKEEGTVFDKKTPIKDEKNNTIMVPKGFKIAKDSGDTVQQGIVIEDVSASTDANVQGSQYVWIPVGTFTKDDGTTSANIQLARYTFDDLGAPTIKQYAANYTESTPINIKDIDYTESATYDAGKESGGSDGRNATAKDLKGFIDSVDENGGYYIGRYEASYASGSSTSNYKAASKVSTGYLTTLMSYTKGTLWNWITQPAASKVAINTYAGSTSVKSDLINSYAWDTAIVYIQEAGNTNYANQKRAYSSLSNTGNLAKGVKDEVCKINDMASNVSEMTTEHSSNIVYDRPCPGVRRGGDYTVDSSYTSIRYDGGVITNESADAGFRLSLYM